MDADKHLAERKVPSAASMAALESRVHRALLEGGELEPMLARVLVLLAPSVRIDWAALVERDGQSSRITCAWDVGAAAEPASDRASRGFEVPGIDMAAVSREDAVPLLWGGELSELLASKGLVRVLAVPLARGGAPRAALLLARREDEGMPQPSRALLESLARPIGTMHEAAGRERDLERRVDERMRELSVLYEVTRSAGAILRHEEFLRLLASALHTLMENDLATVLIDLPGRTELSVHLSGPASAACQAEAADVTRAAYARFAGRAAPACEPLLCTLDEFEPGAAVIQGRLGSHRSAPLVRRGDVVGALCVFSRGEDLFSESEIRLFHTLANQASLTLDRLRTLQEAEENRLQSIIDSLPNGVLTTDRELRVGFMNPAARRCLELLTGSPAPERLEALGAHAVSDLCRPILEGERESVSAEAAISDPRRVFSVGAGTLAGGEGSPAGLVFVLTDVTESRLIQEQFQQTEKLSALGEMISGVAHELNNPLASVMGYAQILQRAKTPPEVRAKLEIVYSEAQRCQRIVQNLLTFARKHNPERALLDVNSVLSSILSLLSYQLRVDGIEARPSLSPEIPAVLGDFHQLQQVFLNILNNAHQAMREAGAGGILEVVSAPAEAGVRVEVRDTGPGIGPENLKRIFDPFFTTKDVGKGTGLGLSLAYATVMDHEGRIYARSRPGSGTTLVVELPAAAVQAPAAAPGRETRADCPPRAASILVVDDEPALAGLLVEALASEGHRALAVADGREALERVRTGTYDLIISDVKMPEMDGRRLFDEVRRISPGLARRMIFSTGDLASAETRKFLEDAGAAAIAKPFDLEEVYRVIDQVLQEAGP